MIIKNPATAKVVLLCIDTAIIRIAKLFYNFWASYFSHASANVGAFEKILYCYHTISIIMGKKKNNHLWHYLYHNNSSLTCRLF